MPSMPAILNVGPDTELSSRSRGENAKESERRTDRASAQEERKLCPGNEVIAEVRKQTDTILLSFSCGKDAIASWLECRRHFTHIVPYFLYLVPDLEFVEESVQYYERYFGCHIMRLPHPSLYRWLVHGFFQAPSRVPILDAAELPEYDYADIDDLIRIEKKLKPLAYTALGVRSADSPARQVSLKRWGAINHNAGKFYPIHDWNKARLIEVIKTAGVRLPIDYAMFGRSFDGLNYEYLKPIKERFPRDYARILEWFPLVDAEIYRRDRAAA